MTAPALMCLFLCFLFLLSLAICVRLHVAALEYFAPEKVSFSQPGVPRWVDQLLGMAYLNLVFISLLATAYWGAPVRLGAVAISFLSALLGPWASRWFYSRRSR